MFRILPESEEYLEYADEEDRPHHILYERFLHEAISVLQPVKPVCAELGTSLGSVVRQMQRGARASVGSSLDGLARSARR